MSLRKISIEPLGTDDALKKDRIRIMQPSLSSGSIETEEDLLQVLRLGDPRTVIAIARKDLSEQYMDGIWREIGKQGWNPTKDRFEKWNEAGGLSPWNAIPHVHGELNCHAAPQATATSTAFFSRHIVIDVLEKLSLDCDYSIGIRRELRTIVDNDRRSLNHPDVLFQQLHGMKHPRENQSTILHLVQDMQRRIQNAGGLTHVPLDENGAGIIAIPESCAHGRNATEDLVRREGSTGWKYFDIGQ